MNRRHIFVAGGDKVPEVVNRALDALAERYPNFVVITDPGCPAFAWHLTRRYGLRGFPSPERAMREGEGEYAVLFPPETRLRAACEAKGMSAREPKVA